MRPVDSRGLWSAFAAYGLWGLLPVYWKFLVQVPALEILLHRMVWSLALLVAILAFTGRLRKPVVALGERRTLAVYTLAALLLSVNWGIYIWAVNHDFIVETSLGYFINPLMSVLLGVLVFRERLRVLQWGAIGLAAVGVAYLTAVYGRLPWISLALAVSFAIYGVLKKVAPLGALDGLTLETALMFLPAMALLVRWQLAGSGSFGHFGAATDLLLVGAGAATTLPLLFFAAAARRLPLTLIGVIQYLAPTLQFLLGVAVYGEPFDRSRLVGFTFIWAALILFTVEGWYAGRRRGTVGAPGGGLG